VSDNGRPSIHLFEPLARGGSFIRGDIGDDASGYSHTIAAFGGYWDASLNFPAQTWEIGDWISNGLGRHIETYNHAQVKIFEAFVNQIEIKLAGATLRIGPLMQIANRARVQYRTISYNTNPPIGGNPAETAVANNTASQTKYGIFEQVLSGGERTAAEAEQIRDSFLAERANPDVDDRLTLTGEGSNIEVSLECLGYVHMLTRYIYNQVAASGTVNLSAKLAAVLDADPNGLFSSSNASIATNTTQVGQHENDNAQALSIVKDLVNRGDSSFARYLFGVYNDRKAVYQAAPTAIGYEHRVSDPAQQIERIGGSLVYVWDVQAGKWLFIPDLPTGELAAQADLRADPRAVFIESATYTAPWGIDLEGGKLSTLPQVLAQFGLGSI
jgi:hypothetical protein